MLDVQQVAAVQEQLLPCNGAMMLLQNVDESFVNVKESAGILEVELVSSSQLQSTEHGESATMHLPRITEQQVNDDW